MEVRSKMLSQAQYKGYCTMGQPTRKAAGNRQRDWMTTSEAAEHAQVSAQTIRRWCEAKPGFARQVGKIWRVDPASLRSLLGETLDEGKNDGIPTEEQFRLF